MSQQILEDFWDFYHRVHDDEMVHPYAWKVRRPDLWSYAPILEGFARQNNALEANKVFARLLKVKTTSPNIQCYTSVMKANEDDPVSVHNLAHQCLDEYQKQQQDPKTNDTQKIVIDNAFFTAWLNACAKARQTEVAKKIMSKHMKSIAGLQPQTTTYLSFLKVFLSNDDSQGAIEWLLGYAKMEKMTEATIVAWTFALIDWYSERDKTSLKRFDDNIDLNIMLQLLVENKLITSSTSFERFLMRLPSKASLQLLSCILASNQGEIDTISTLKMYAIVMHSLAHVKDGAPIIEDLFDDCLSMIATLHETGEELERVRSELYASVLVSWAKQGNFDRIMYWMDRMRDDYGLGVPPLSLPAQTAVVNAFCRAGRVVEAEKIVLSMKKAYEEGTPYVSPPDTFLYNMILRGWMMQKNGHQAYAFLDQHTPNADYISYNYVINALCMEDNLDAAEDLSSRLVDRFRSSPQASLRPNDLTFTPILAGWRRNGDRPDAAKRAEKILQRMINLYGQGVMLRGPDIKSFQVVMDTWDKSSDPNASKHAHKLLVTAPKDIRHSKKLWARLRKLQDNRRLGKGKHRNLSSEESA
jgi:pentatricopeptide repeat protein